ncbi:unnamed protein product, partial [Durusdinium trenchii]
MCTESYRIMRDLPSQLRSSSTGHSRSSNSREARAAAQQLHRFRHASVGSCRPHEYPELVVAALDVASVLEERLADAEQRLSQLLRSVEFLEELRELFQSRSPKFAIRPPPFQ